MTPKTSAEATSAEAFAPATMANLGVGFDILGLALEGLGDTVITTWHDTPGVTILDIEGDGGALPRESGKNTAAIAANAVLKLVKANRGVGIHLKKGLPLASGLGSSSSSAVAAAVAVNALLGNPLSKAEVLSATLEAEAAVSGYHADNVGPCLFGGITLITGTSANDIRNLPVPDNLYLALVTPNVAVPTAEARAVLPQSVPLKQMVAQTGHVAVLIDALYRGDIATLAEAMEGDGVVEPARAHLMPLLQEARFVSKREGAYGLVISGAGPTLAAVCDDGAAARRTATALQMLYDDAKIGGITHTSRVNKDGAQVVKIH